MSPATKIMLKWTIDFKSGCVFDKGVQFKANEIENRWLDEMETYSDEYDETWFPLIATEAIRKTIDWKYIANELPELHRLTAAGRGKRWLPFFY